MLRVSPGIWAAAGSILSCLCSYVNGFPIAWKCTAESVWFMVKRTVPHYGTSQFDAVSVIPRVTNELRWNYIWDDHCLWLLALLRLRSSAFGILFWQEFFKILCFVVLRAPLKLNSFRWSGAAFNCPKSIVVLYNYLQAGRTTVCRIPLLRWTTIEIWAIWEWIADSSKKARSSVAAPTALCFDEIRGKFQRIFGHFNKVFTPILLQICGGGSVVCRYPVATRLRWSGCIITSTHDTRPVPYLFS